MCRKTRETGPATENDGFELSARGPAEELLPVAFVPNVSDVFTYDQAFGSTDQESGARFIVLHQVVPSHGSPLRSLALFEGRLHSSIDFELPAAIRRSLMSFCEVDPPVLQRSIPEMSAGEALLRIAGRVAPRAPWRVERSSFEAAWEEAVPADR